jgi:hypothetical protein
VSAATVAIAADLTAYLSARTDGRVRWALYRRDYVAGGVADSRDAAVAAARAAAAGRGVQP